MRTTSSFSTRSAIWVLAVIFAIGVIAEARPLQAGLLPLLLSSGTGSEVQRPLATAVTGGLVTPTALTLLVLPAIYRWFAPRAANQIRS